MLRLGHCTPPRPLHAVTDLLLDRSSSACWRPPAATRKLSWRQAAKQQRQRQVSCVSEILWFHAGACQCTGSHERSGDVLWVFIAFQCISWFFQVTWSGWWMFMAGFATAIDLQTLSFETKITLSKQVANCVNIWAVWVWDFVPGQIRQGQRLDALIWNHLTTEQSWAPVFVERNSAGTWPISSKNWDPAQLIFPLAITDGMQLQCNACRRGETAWSWSKGRLAAFTHYSCGLAWRHGEPKLKRTATKLLRMTNQPYWSQASRSRFRTWLRNVLFFLSSHCALKNEVMQGDGVVLLQKSWAGRRRTSLPSALRTEHCSSRWAVGGCQTGLTHLPKTFLSVSDPFSFLSIFKTLRCFVVLRGHSQRGLSGL